MNMFKGNVQCTYQFHKCTVYRLLAVQSLRRTIEPQRKPAGAYCICLTGVLFLANLYVASLSDYHVSVTMSRFQRLMSCWIKQLAVCKGTIEMIILDPHPYHPDQ